MTGCRALTSSVGTHSMANKCTDEHRPRAASQVLVGFCSGAYQNPAFELLISVTWKGRGFYSILCLDVSLILFVDSYESGSFGSTVYICSVDSDSLGICIQVQLEKNAMAEVIT